MHEPISIQVRSAGYPTIPCRPPTLIYPSFMVYRRSVGLFSIICYEGASLFVPFLRTNNIPLYRE